MIPLIHKLSQQPFADRGSTVFVDFLDRIYTLDQTVFSFTAADNHMTTSGCVLVF